MDRDQNRLPYLDALRGCAIIMVILVHTSQAVPPLSSIAHMFAWAGQMGVQLFFLASAYSLCFVQQQPRDTQNPTLGFYIRRYFRVAPLYYVAILFYGAMAMLSAPDGIWAHTENYTAPTIAANTLLIQGFVQNGNNSVVPGGWSVGTEVAFYLVFPVLWNFVQAKKDQQVRRASMLLLAALTICALHVAWLSAHGVTVTNNSFSYFNIANQLPVFALGALAYVLWPKPQNERFPMAAVPLLCLFTTVSVYLAGKDVPFAFSLLPFTAGLAFMQLLRILRALPEIRWLQAVGRQSYSIFLFHFVFAWHVSKAAADVMGTHIPADVLWLLLSGMALLGSYAVAVLIGSQIEKIGIACGHALVRHLSRDQRVYKLRPANAARTHVFDVPMPRRPQPEGLKPFMIPAQRGGQPTLQK